MCCINTESIPPSSLFVVYMACTDKWTLQSLVAESYNLPPPLRVGCTPAKEVSDHPVRLREGTTNHWLYSMARFPYQYLFFLPETLPELFAATRALANG